MSRTECPLDRGRDEVAILLQRLELVGMGQQQQHQIARRAICGLEPGGQKQPKERDDRFVGEFLAVDLGCDEIADDVVGHGAAPLVHLLLEVGAQFDRCRQTGLDVLGDRDQVQRQPPEQLQVLLRQAEKGGGDPGGEFERHRLDQIGRPRRS